MSCCLADSEEDKYSEWRVDHAYRTLKDAEEFKKDAKMMKLVGKLLKKEEKSIKSLADLREKLKLSKEDEE